MPRTSSHDERRSGLTVALAAAALAVAVASWFREPGAAAIGAPAAAGSNTNAALEAMRSDLAELRQRYAHLEPATARVESLDKDRLAVWIEEILRTRGATSKGASAGEPGTAAAPAAGNLASLVQALGSTPMGPARDELWKQIRAQGGIAAAVALLEQNAAAQPASADAQTELGAAYIELMLETIDEQQRNALGTKIDTQFDRALELQPDHWEARFRKAVGLTYGPALSGRQEQAIEQFERLVSQQTNQPPQAGQAQTYLYLGRLYAQRGDQARARAIWQQGFARHPGAAELQELLRR